MHNRKKIRKTLDFRLPVRSKSSKDKFTWKELISTPGIETTDIVIGITYKPFLSNVNDETSSCNFIPCVTVYRDVEETDDEFLERIQEEENELKKADERDRLEYLRLKAKFEPNL